MCLKEFEFKEWYYKTAIKEGTEKILENVSSNIPTLEVNKIPKNFKIEHILQIPVSIAFGYFIDLTMNLLGFVNPTMYVTQILYLLLGCIVLGIGVYMEVLANVVMLPGESFVRAIVFKWKTDFGSTKIVFDVSMTVIAGILSFIFMGHLAGVREGTIIAALLVGFIARFIGRKLSFLPEKIYNKNKNIEEIDNNDNNDNNEKLPLCIVIGRQYGCGGHEIGKYLAEKLGFDFYDREIIKIVANTTNYIEQFINKKDEKMVNNSIYDLVNYMYEQMINMKYLKILYLRLSLKL